VTSQSVRIVHVEMGLNVNEKKHQICIDNRNQDFDKFLKELQENISQEFSPSIFIQYGTVPTFSA